MWATATLNAFLLKVVLEEKLGFPTLLISDYDDMFNDTESVIEGLARGDAHLYPEVRSGCMPQVLRPLRLLSEVSPLLAGLAFSRGGSLPPLLTRGDGVYCYPGTGSRLLPVCIVRERVLLLR